MISRYLFCPQRNSVKWPLLFPPILQTQGFEKLNQSRGEKNTVGAGDQPRPLALASFTLHSHG